jgi:UDP-N-acetylglucosamine 2-epimerase (non-hydrolysing)
MKDLTHFSSKQFWVKNGWIPEKFRLDYILKDSNIKTMAPLSYLAFLSLWRDASLILTDSGGIQEETTVLGIPCFTIRENTESPITIKQGTNILVGTTGKGILQAYKQFKRGIRRKGRVPELWDGKAAERIVQIIEKQLKV